ncbi:hypothetical protein [Nguyenibacter sp. L1]|uniref:hypothetical protein n=1 Tax=Nguyenibacter sp. L1 TaxID=3049350 RepID=UPI002B4A0E5C|nr:hypothetical protein [Nguyenibacter sp. L1]WRH89323.1 hypothetical protein QN315_06900 [Nguyenibacter sp. L1]
MIFQNPVKSSIITIFGYGRLTVPADALRDWEQARATPADFAIAYVRVIGQFPDIVAEAVA